MPQYKAPVRDMQFLINELYRYPEHYAAIGHAELDAETVMAVVDQGARFAEQELFPLNAVGDEHGCRLENGQVYTPPGFKQAYQSYMENGWSGLSSPESHGGQGLPESLGVFLTDMFGACNPAWYMYAGLTKGALTTLAAHGSAELRDTYMPSMISGAWGGTMCLTEPHCGSDLGLLKTRAVPQADGSYRITGTKIFISAGDQDITENIVHLVLARIEGAPAGTQGISLFVVPKFLPTAPGVCGERNTVACGSLEHKMGIKGAATCVMNFDDAKGFLLGEANRGLRCMFTMMNHARLATAMQGLCLGETSYQNAVSYARERLQMRSLSGPKAPDKAADPIIVHPDVRRMLLTMKSLNEGSRALAYYTAQQMDLAEAAQHAEQRQSAADELAFLTPICKAFMTDSGMETTLLGMQVFGGHGYIRESGQEQLVRDCRIAPIYEGTNGIQALDLLGRKVLGSQGKLLRGFSLKVQALAEQHSVHARLGDYAKTLGELNAQWASLGLKAGMAAMKNPDEVGAAAVDFLMFSGYLVLGYFWLRMAYEAEQALEQGSDERLFYEGKLGTCDFYFQRILPRAQAHAQMMLAGASSLMQLSEAHF